MISVVINTLNEEKNIERAIRSVKKLASEIIVVDMESDDNTVKLAKKLGANVYSHKRTQYVEPARNFAIQKAEGPWILILDADEEISSELSDEITRIVSSDFSDFVRIPRKNLIFGKWMMHARWWPDYNIRLFKKGSVLWEDEIHSVPITNGRDYNIVAREELSIIHHHYDSVEQFVDRMNRYTTIQSRELFKKNIEVTSKDLITKPTSEFVSRYFAGEGYKDGLHGLSLSLLQGASELVLYIKLWQLGGFKEKHIELEKISIELKETQKEVNYWKANSQLQARKSLGNRIKRKFRLP